MRRFRVEIRVKPRPGLLDPQGKAIHHALHALGWDGVAEVRVGKVMDIELAAEDEAAAAEVAEAMCRKILANPVTEDYEVSVLGRPEEAHA